MAATINWAQLGVGIPSKFAEKYEPVNMNTDAYVKAGDQINGMFDRWNREKAIGGLYSDQLAALRAKCQELNAKLRKLNDELAEAKQNDESYKAQQTLMNTDPTYKMSGYQSPTSYMQGYTPNEAGMTLGTGSYDPDMDKAYSNAYAMFGAQQRNVRM